MIYGRRTLTASFGAFLAISAGASFAEPIKIEPVHDLRQVVAHVPVVPLLDREREPGVRVVQGNAYAVQKYKKVVINGINVELDLADCPVERISSLSASETERVEYLVDDAPGSRSTSPDPAYLLSQLRNKADLCRRSPDNWKSQVVALNYHKPVRAAPVPEQILEPKNSSRTEPQFLVRPYIPGSSAPRTTTGRAEASGSSPEVGLRPHRPIGVKLDLRGIYY